MRILEHLAVLLGLLLVSRGAAQTPSPSIPIAALSQARLDWHLAAVSEDRTDWAGAINYYTQLRKDATPLPLEMRTWFRGTAYYGQGLCEARLGDAQSAKKSINSAAEMHFWDFALIASDSVLREVVGEQWIDSVEAYWDNVRSAETGVWPAQEVKVIRPLTDSLQELLPVIIALHGGNSSYEEFAEYWPRIAEALHAIVVVPPGILRFSDVTNSWGYDVAPVEKMLIELVQSIKAQRVGDSNRIYLAGFSQGAQMTIEVGLRHPELFSGLVSICGFAEQAPDSIALARSRKDRLRVLMICADHENPHYKLLSARVEAALQDAAIPLKVDCEQGTLHEMPLDFENIFIADWGWLTSQDFHEASREHKHSHQSAGKQ